VARGLGKQDVDRELNVVFSAVFADLRPFVVEAVGALRWADTPEDYVELTVTVLEQFLRHQVAQEQVRERQTERKDKLALLIAQSPRPIVKIRAINQEVKIDERFDHDLVCALHALRGVGDGIAWRALDYDRRAISVMGDGRRVGRLADDKGLKAELDEMGRLWTQERRFAIHNDLTNCLRHGDLTIPGTLNGRAAVEVAEIKVSGREKSVQSSRLEDKLRFIRTGHRPAVGDGPADRILPPVPRLRTYQGLLREAIVLARAQGYADFSPHQCLTFAVVDYDEVNRKPALGEDWALRAPRRRGWNPLQPRVIQLSNFTHRLRERHTSFPFLAPYAIFPLAAEDVTDLILGMLDVCATLNCDELQRTLAQAGLQSEVAGGRDAEHFFLRASDGKETITVPAVIREQMLTELMMPETLIETIRVSLAATSSDSAEQPANQLVPYAHEEAVWSGGS